MKFSEAESIRLSLLSLRADKGDVLTDENYADIAKWKAAIAHSQAPIKNILIEERQWTEKLTNIEMQLKQIALELV